MSKNTLKNIDQISNCFHIKYYPKVKIALGCERATIILGRLEYWFGVPKFAKGFYKFVEPCQHPLYKEGDSWAEELGFSRKVFAKAFEVIGVRYKSKSAFNNAEDKFRGKLYASYHDRKTNKTFFVRNHEFASDFINNLFQQKKNSGSSSNQRPSKENEKVEIQPIFSSPKIRSRNGQNGRSSWGTIGGKESLSLIQRKTSSLNDHSEKTKNLPDSIDPVMTEEMKKIWIEEIGTIDGPVNSKTLTKRLNNVFIKIFKESLEEWRSYCALISSSKFLMGEGSNKFFKKAWLSWAIDEENIEKIRGGGFSLGDRPTKLDEKVMNISRDLQKLERDREIIESQISRIKTSIIDERKQAVKKEISSISKEEISQLRKKFETELLIQDDAIGAEFRRRGWEGTFVETSFRVFLEEKTESVLFTTTLEDDEQNAISKTDLIERRMRVCEQIEFLNQKRQVLRSSSNISEQSSKAA